MEIIFYIIIKKGKKGNYYDILHNYKIKQDIYHIIRTDIKIIIAIVFIFILIGCAETKYITIPLTRPPARYEIYEITNNQQALLEYRKATMFIARWQNWYNSNVGSNYYNYKNYSNTKPDAMSNADNYIIFTNITTNELLITNR